jgi:hypothetical protein
VHAFEGSLGIWFKKKRAIYFLFTLKPRENQWVGTALAEGDAALQIFACLPTFLY